MLLLRYLVIGLTYLGLGLGYFPGLRMNRATIALVGAAALLALGLLDLQTAWAAIDYRTLIFLFSIMVVSGSLEIAGFFRLALDFLVRWAHSPFGLIVVLTLGSGFLSALFLNDAIALILTPLVVNLTRTLRLNPLPYLLALAGATNLGSVATLSGNPQNILIGSFSGISYLDFARALAPLAVMGLFIQIGWLWWLYPEVRLTQPLPPLHTQRYRILRPSLLKSLVITAGMLVGFLVGVPLAEASLIAAGLILITRRVKPERFLQRVDWDLLVMFAGLFILTEGVQKLGSLDWFAGMVSQPLPILGITVLLSNLVSNVPAILLLHSLIPHPTEQIWLLLAAVSTLAGNLTLLGSVANLIVAEATSKNGHHLSFGEHLRFGLPLTVVTLALTYGWLILKPL
jgi:Na+/H+ antiporter NhaD/arsenite permease-like protein